MFLGRKGIFRRNRDKMVKTQAERKCGEYCHICKHRFVKNQGLSLVPSYGCLLDCDCKDFCIGDPD